MRYYACVNKMSVTIIQIELGFLMVGHTHEDIDALFGNISTWLKRNDALTIPG